MRNKTGRIFLQILLRNGNGGQNRHKVFSAHIAGAGVNDPLRQEPCGQLPRIMYVDHGTQAHFLRRDRPSAVLSVQADLFTVTGGCVGTMPRVLLTR